MYEPYIKTILETTNHCKTPLVSPYFIGIDGLSGAGKSCFASELSSVLANSQIVCLDDFYDNTIYSIDLSEAFRVLNSLQKNTPVSYFPYDWNLRNKSSCSVYRVTTNIVIVEGVYALKSMLLPLYSFKVWLNCEATEAFSRALNRDLEFDSEIKKLWLDHWLPCEHKYVEEYSPSSIADLVVNA
ncbi:hypothetical protein KC980_03075 [candidate division WWE3 bacterium]|uniref:Phosphoribulokinase/uridine kinase domain-containing protein n=1 Tax=candidate division WWE3 bacterium TaxID=2053526 RepID=A0A955EE48_UNCKA|nr:hypothetical protein [candidate division WWE3 bacterium]